MPTLDETRVDRVIQLALAAAAREDEFRNRRLGPIHLIKHVYLADLAYAEAHGGDTYTGAPWRFHHFGPWAAEVFARVEPAVDAIQAERQAFSSRYDTDTVRYSVDDPELFQRLERGLPWEVVSAVTRAVREHGSDTYGLLNDVYLTKPMLRAAPEEYLAFEAAEAGEPMPATAEPPRVPVAARRRHESAVADLRERIQAQLGARLARPAAPVRPPRYDEVFFDGLAALDAAADGSVPPTEGQGEFTPEIWKSPGRTGSDVP